MPILPKFTKILLIFITLTILGCSIFLNIYLLNSKETSNETSNDLTNLDLSNDYLQNQLQLTSNSEPIKSFAYTDPNKPLKQILKVARLSQLPDYPNGCEATSATMLLNYYGINITLSQFIDDYLPQKGVYLKDNLRYGPNPALYYAGDPSSQENGWGCYEPVIENSLKTIIKDNSANFKVLNLTNQNLSTLESYLPVVIWTTID